MVRSHLEPRITVPYQQLINNVRKLFQCGSDIWIKILLFIPRPPGRTSKLDKKLSALKRELPALQNIHFFTFSIFVGHFCPPRIWIESADPDPADN
jgi:hypothetical protein